jgi:hypothetical protein
MAIDPNTGLPFVGITRLTENIPASREQIIIDSTSSSTQSTNASINTDSPLEKPRGGLDFQKLSWSKFLRLIWQATSEQERLDYDHEKLSPFEREMHKTANDHIVDFVKLYAELVAHLRACEEHYKPLDDVRQLVQDYQNQIDFTNSRMNAVIQAYNDGKMIEEDFQNAIAGYEKIISDLKAQYEKDAAAYNKQVDANNAAINTLNLQRKNWGLPLLPLLEKISATLTLESVSIPESGKKVPSLEPPQRLPIFQTPPLLSLEQIMHTVYDPKLEYFINTVNYYRHKERSRDDELERLMQLKILFPRIPASVVISLNDHIGINNATIISMNSPTLKRIVNEAVYHAELAKLNLQIPEQLHQEIRLFTLSVVSQASLIAAMRIDPSLMETLGVAGIRTLAAFELMHYMNRLLRSDIIDTVVEHYVALHNLPQEVADILKLSVKQNFWMLAVANVSLSTGMYGLPLQLLSHLPGFIFPSGTAKSIDFQQLLRDPAVRESLKHLLIEQITQKGEIQETEAQRIIEDIVDRLPDINFASLPHLHTWLTETVASEIDDKDLAQVLADQIIAYLVIEQLEVELEENPLYLSQAFLNNSSFVNFLYAENPVIFISDHVDRNIFMETLALVFPELNPSITPSTSKRLAAEIADRALVIQSEYVSIHEFIQKVADEIAAELNSDSITSDDILPFLEKVDLGIAIPRPLFHPGKPHPMDLKNLSQSFRSELESFFISQGVDPETANSLAEAKTIEMIESPSSMYNLMLELDTKFKEMHLEKRVAYWADAHRSMFPISRELSLFMAAVAVDPILFSNLVSIQGSQTLLDNELPLSFQV